MYHESMSNSQEGKLHRNKDNFDSGFDDIKFPKRKGSAIKDAKEKRRKAWLRNILLQDEGEYDEIDLHVDQAYERCRGFDY